MSKARTTAPTWFSKRFPTQLQSDYLPRSLLFHLVHLIFKTLGVRGHFDLGRLLVELLATDSVDKWGRARIHKQLGSFERPVRSLTLSPNEDLLAAGDESGRINLWNLRSAGALMNEVKGHLKAVRSLAFSSDGSKLVSGSEDNTAKIWLLFPKMEQLGRLDAHTGWVNAVAFVQNSTHVLSGSGGDSQIMLTRVSDMTVIRTFLGHQAAILCLAVSPTRSTFCSGSMDTTIHVWDLDLNQAALVLRGHTDTVSCVQISPSPPYTILSGSWDKSIKLWDAQTGHLVRTLAGHTGLVFSVYFMRSDLFASCSSDKTWRVWGLHDSSLVKQQCPQRSLVFGRKTGRLFTADGERFSVGNVVEWWSV